MNEGTAKTILMHHVIMGDMPKPSAASAGDKLVDELAASIRELFALEETDRAELLECGCVRCKNNLKTLDLLARYDSGER